MEQKGEGSDGKKLKICSDSIYATISTISYAMITLGVHRVRWMTIHAPRFLVRGVNAWIRGPSHRFAQSISISLDLTGEPLGLTSS